MEIMGRAKRHRKILSGTKMMKHALQAQQAICAVQMAAMAALSVSMIEIIAAQKMVKPEKDRPKFQGTLIGGDVRGEVIIPNELQKNEMRLQQLKKYME